MAVASVNNETASSTNVVALVILATVPMIPLFVLINTSPTVISEVNAVSDPVTVVLEVDAVTVPCTTLPTETEASSANVPDDISVWATPCTESYTLTVPIPVDEMITSPTSIVLDASETPR